MAAASGIPVTSLLGAKAPATPTLSKQGQRALEQVEQQFRAGEAHVEVNVSSEGEPAR